MIWLFGTSFITSHTSVRLALSFSAALTIGSWTGWPEKGTTPFHHVVAGLPSGPRIESSQSVASCGVGAFGDTKPEAMWVQGRGGWGGLGWGGVGALDL